MKYSLLRVSMYLIHMTVVFAQKKPEPKKRPPNPTYDLYIVILTILISIMTLLAICLFCLYQKGYRLVQVDPVQEKRTQNEEQTQINSNENIETYNTLPTTQTTISHQ